MENESKEALAKEWGLVLTENVSEEHLMAALEARISALLSGSSEDFFQMMYRLDIDEQKLRDAFAAADVPAALAWLVWARQLQKIRSRACYPGAPPADDELKW